MSGTPERQREAWATIQAAAERIAEILEADGASGEKRLAVNNLNALALRRLYDADAESR